MTRQTVYRLAPATITMAVSAILAALLALAGFETRAAHSADLQQIRQEHEGQYGRVLCELEAIRREDASRVCR